MTTDEREEDSAPWAALCHRGKLSIVVLSRARAEADRIPMHAEASHVVLLLPDDGECAPMSCLSIDSVLLFMREMLPRRVNVMVAAHEDVMPLTEILMREGATIH